MGKAVHVLPWRCHVPQLPGTLRCSLHRQILHALQALQQRNRPMHGRDLVRLCRHVPGSDVERGQDQRAHQWQGQGPVSGEASLIPAIHERDPVLLLSAMHGSAELDLDAASMAPDEVPGGADCLLMPIWHRSHQCSIVELFRSPFRKTALYRTASVQCGFKASKEFIDQTSLQVYSSEQPLPLEGLVQRGLRPVWVQSLQGTCVISMQMS